LLTDCDASTQKKWQKKQFFAPTYSILQQKATFQVFEGKKHQLMPKMFKVRLLNLSEFFRL